MPRIKSDERGHACNVYLTDEQHERIAQCARLLGMSFSGFVKKLCEDFITRNAEQLATLEENKKILTDLF